MPTFQETTNELMVDMLARAKTDADKVRTTMAQVSSLHCKEGNEALRSHFLAAYMELAQALGLLDLIVDEGNEYLKKDGD